MKLFKELRMKKEILKNSLTEQTGFGLTAAAIILPYCVCVGAALSQGLLPILLCSVVCIFCSLKLKNGVFAPDAFLFVPIFYIFSVQSFMSSCISVLLGAFVFLSLKKLLKDRKIPDAVMVGGALSLAIGATILLTNHYFGIGATGETPLQMLKSFHSLGFHPNFRGLLYGTITLFTMITYPFKFRKLNRYIPAEFITILIPFVLNLFLNPQKELTTINEANLLSVADTFENISSYFVEFSTKEIPNILKNALSIGIILFGYSACENAPKTTDTLCANALSGAFSGLSVRKFSTRGYGVFSAIIAFVVTVIPIIFFPDVFSRIPMHCVGSMLIVSAWQSIPYKVLVKVFKTRSLVTILIFAVCAVLFVALDIFGATIAYLLITLLYNKTSFPEKGVSVK